MKRIEGVKFRMIITKRTALCDRHLKTVEKGLRPDLPEEAKRVKLDLKKIPKDEYGQIIKDLSGQMELAAANLQFEQAAELRDIIADIKPNFENHFKIIRI